MNWLKRLFQNNPITSPTISRPSFQCNVPLRGKTNDANRKLKKTSKTRVSNLNCWESANTKEDAAAAISPARR